MNAFLAELTVPLLSLGQKWIKSVCWLSKKHRHILAAWWCHVVPFRCGFLSPCGTLQPCLTWHPPSPPFHVSLWPTQPWMLLLWSLVMIFIPSQPSPCLETSWCAASGWKGRTNVIHSDASIQSCGCDSLGNAEAQILTHSCSCSAPCPVWGAFCWMACSTYQTEARTGTKHPWAAVLRCD